ncbi:FxLYD domain-containing protein [Candidatus Binatus sp.]|uniref:FxLYD domain-containing protein n=1 Tax=Candidatus Binatus sp. TaxID=2811406 RepID=UPI003C5485C3
MRKGAIIVLLGAVCFAAYVFYSLTGVEPVKVADTRLVRSGDRVSVEGEVRNTGDDTGPLQLEVRYFDRDGHSIGKDVVSMDGLRRGAVAHFKSSARPDDGVADFSIYLNHGRNPYGN